MGAPGWSIERTSGSAGAFHDRPPPAPLRPTVWIHRVDRPALVLGSTQRAPLIDDRLASEDGVEVCQRRSGGGLVFVDPDTSLWIDVIIPRGHELWNDDVGLAFDWVGQAWAAALRQATLRQTEPTGRTAVSDEPAEADASEHGVRVHHGALLRPDWGRVICFAGLGPGEVTVNDRKVVGLSQRRTREAARFQGLAVTSLASEQIRRFVSPGALPPDLDAALDELAVGIPLDLEQLASLFIASLPTA